MLFMSRVQSDNFYSCSNTPANLSDTSDRIHTAGATINTRVLPQMPNYWGLHRYDDDKKAGLDPSLPTTCLRRIGKLSSGENSVLSITEMACQVLIWPPILFKEQKIHFISVETMCPK